jgi:hypothetical protein
VNTPLSVENIGREFRKLLYRDVAASIHGMQDPNGKVILNSDDLFKMLPRYADNPDQRIHLGPVLYPIAAKFTDLIYSRLLKIKVSKDDTVIFTAGGSATGKTSILRTAGKTPGVSFVVDTTFSNAKRAISQVNRALRSERKVEIHYVYRDFRESVIGMVQRALDPKSGRIVPVDDMARTHFGAQRTILDALERYQDEPRVSTKLKENVGGKLRQINVESFVKRLFESVDFLQKWGQSVLDEIRENKDLQGENSPEGDDPRRARIPFSKAFYEAARSKAQGGGKSAREGDAGGISEGSEKSE